MPTLCFRTFSQDGSEFGRGAFTYGGSEAAGDALLQVTQGELTDFSYQDARAGSFARGDVATFHFVRSPHPSICAFNVNIASPDRLRSLVGGPAQPGTLRVDTHSTGGGTTIQLMLEYPTDCQGGGTAVQETASATPPPPAPPAPPAPAEVAPEPAVEPVPSSVVDAAPEPPPIVIPASEPAPPAADEAPHIGAKTEPKRTPARPWNRTWCCSRQVVIVSIAFDGGVKRTESDEYVVVGNEGSEAADIGGWRLHADDRGQEFACPEGTVLQPGQMVRVYTNEVHPETGGYSFESGSALWNNHGDTGRLFDDSGALVSSFAYGKAIE